MDYTVQTITLHSRLLDDQDRLEEDDMVATRAVLEMDRAVTVVTDLVVTAVAVTVGGLEVSIHKADQMEDHQVDQVDQVEADPAVMVDVKEALHRRTDDGYHHPLGPHQAPSASGNGCGSCRFGVR